MGPDQLSFGFAFQPNGVDTPFGNTRYHQHHLLGHCLMLDRRRAGFPLSVVCPSSLTVWGHTLPWSPYARLTIEDLPAEYRTREVDSIKHFVGAPNDADLKDGRPACEQDGFCINRFNSTMRALNRFDAQTADLRIAADVYRRNGLGDVFARAQSWMDLHFPKVFPRVLRALEPEEPTMHLTSNSIHIDPRKFGAEFDRQQAEAEAAGVAPPKWRGVLVRRGSLQSAANGR